MNELPTNAIFLISCRYRTLHSPISQSSSEKARIEQSNDEPPPRSTHWKVFVVLVCGHAGQMCAEGLINEIQKHHPEASIIGGVASKCDVSLSLSEMVLVVYL